MSSKTSVNGLFSLLEKHTYNILLNGGLSEFIVDFYRNYDVQSFDIDEKFDSSNIWEEYMKFISMKAIFGDMKKVVPSIEIDLVWHFHILDTRSYRRLNEIIGFYLSDDSYFIHHERASSEEEHELNKMAYAETLLLYKQKFESDPPIKFWKSPDVRFSTGIRVVTFDMSDDISSEGEAKSQNTHEMTGEMYFMTSPTDGSVAKGYWSCG